MNFVTLIVILIWCYEHAVARSIILIIDLGEGEAYHDASAPGYPSKDLRLEPGAGDNSMQHKHLPQCKLQQIQQKMATGQAKQDP